MTTTITTPPSAQPSPDALLDQILAKQRELAALRDKVRLTIIAQRKRGWCRAGRQDVLDELGLAPIAYAYSGSASVTIRFDSLPEGVGMDELCRRVSAAIHVAPSTDPDVQFHLVEVQPCISQGEVLYDEEGNVIGVDA
jgi:hypothetical protein